MMRLIIWFAPLAGRDVGLHDADYASTFSDRHRGLPRPCHGKFDLARVDAASSFRERRFGTHWRHASHLGHEQADIHLRTRDWRSTGISHEQPDRIHSRLRCFRFEDLN